jgi:hypothetical protein
MGALRAHGPAEGLADHQVGTLTPAPYDESKKAGLV